MTDLTNKISQFRKDCNFEGMLCIGGSRDVHNNIKVTAQLEGSEDIVICIMSVILNEPRLSEKLETAMRCIEETKKDLMTSKTFM